MSQPSAPSHQPITLQKSAQSQSPPDIPPTDDFGKLLPRLIATPRRCSAGAGVMWLVQAFGLFQRQPLLWLGMGAALLIILGIVSMIPLLNVVMVIIVFLFVGGMMAGAAAESRGDELRFDHLFLGFRSQTKPLLTLGLLYLLGTFVCMLPMAITVGGVMLSLSDSHAAMSDVSITAMMVGYLISLLLFIPLMMAIWFAPALIALHGLGAVTAMKKSFQGSKVNLVPLFVYGLVCMIVLPLIIFFTLGLGIFLVVPVLLLTYFTSYRDVWTDQPLNAH